MRKTLYILMAALAAFVPAGAQTAPEPVVIRNFTITPADNNTKVNVSFTADISKKAVKSDYTLTLTPIITKGGNMTAFHPIVVQGRRARISEKRHIMSDGYVRNSSAIYAGNGQSVEYTATVPYSTWMEKSTLTLHKLMEGCCTEKEITGENLASNITMVPPVVIPDPEPEPQPVVEPKKPTTGDRLAERYPFIMNFDQYGGREVQGDALIVYYRVAKSDRLDRTYRDNDSIVNLLLASISEIQTSDDSYIVKMHITGCASPEGTISHNRKLGHDRAMTARNFILENNPGITPEMIEIVNGEEDWEGLRRLVAASDMKYRDQVLEIIDTKPVWDDATKSRPRLSELMYLKGGEPYRYMLKNFFPDLRNAAYIKIYYENK